MTRDETILSLRSQVIGIAATFYKEFAWCMSAEDLQQSGWIGAIQAVDNFDRNRDANLQTYAGIRIWGAIKDMLRLNDTLSREEREHVKDSLWAPLNFQLRVGPGYANGHYEEDNLPMMKFADKRPNILDHMVDASRTQVLEERINKLKPLRIRNIAWMYCIDGRTLRSIAKELGVGESRVCQLWNVAGVDLGLRELLDPHGSKHGHRKLKPKKRNCQ